MVNEDQQSRGCDLKSNIYVDKPQNLQELQARDEVNRITLEVIRNVQECVRPYFYQI